MNFQGKWGITENSWAISGKSWEVREFLGKIGNFKEFLGNSQKYRKAPVEIVGNHLGNSGIYLGICIDFPGYGKRSGENSRNNLVTFQGIIWTLSGNSQKN